MACDSVYVASISPWLDFRILVGTVFKVFSIPYHVTSRCLALPGVLPVPSQAFIASDRDEEPVSHWLTA